MSVPAKALRAVIYYFSWVLFGIVGLGLNLVCAFFLIFPRRERFGPSARAAIRQLFALWLKWMHATGVVDVRWHGFDEKPMPVGAVYVANHPTLVDATFLLARIPDAICIFKSALLRNPFVAPAAILGGYASGDSGIDLIRSAAEKVVAGCSILIFPEGTRTTPGTKLNPLKPGFALIAQRAQAPIQIIAVRASPGLVPRGRPWWRLPEFPAWVEFTLGEKIEVDGSVSVAEITRTVEQRLTLQAVQRLAPAG
jgi:1-acyl-sn-glycerol-3-phosphate acyltransferase